MHTHPDQHLQLPQVDGAASVAIRSGEGHIKQPRGNRHQTQQEAELVRHMKRYTAIVKPTRVSGVQHSRRKVQREKREAKDDANLSRENKNPYCTLQTPSRSRASA